MAVGSMFNANGMSTVNNVQITGVSINGRDEVSVNLRHDGEEISPAVTVIAIASPIAMMQGAGMGGGMGMMHGDQSGMMMQPTVEGGGSAAPAWQNNTQWQNWHAQMAQWQSSHNQMMAQGVMGPGSAWWNGTSTTWQNQFDLIRPQTGSSVVEAGWTSETSITVRLEGNGSAYDSGGIHVMVFPLTG